MELTVVPEHKVVVPKKFEFSLDDSECASLAGMLFNIKNGYPAILSATGEELLNWLGSRNEVTPSGEDGNPDA